MLVFVFGWILPVHAVVEVHLSMRKIAVISDTVVLCEEIELINDDIELPPNAVTRKVVARCRPVRVLKGTLSADEVFTADYGSKRKPFRGEVLEREVDGRLVQKTPREYFPAGRALLFLSAPDAEGRRGVNGAKLIQDDVIYDLDEPNYGMGQRDLRPKETPENSPPGECLRYGEAELVADYLKGMELLADPAIPLQFHIPRHDDPFAPDPWRAQWVPLVVAVAPALLVLALYWIVRARLPKKAGLRLALYGVAVAFAFGLGLTASSVATIYALRPVRWENVRVGMSRDELRCFVKISQRLRQAEGGEVYLSHLRPFGPRGAWSLHVGYDASGKVERATLDYYGDFRYFVALVARD